MRHGSKPKPPSYGGSPTSELRILKWSTSLSRHIHVYGGRSAVTLWVVDPGSEHVRGPTARPSAQMHRGREPSCGDPAV
jgi:hypothetical protein